MDHLICASLSHTHCWYEVGMHVGSTGVNKAEYQVSVKHTKFNCFSCLDVGIAGDWKAMALEVEVWVEKVTESGRRFMATWRKEEVDAARHRQEKREETRLGKVVIAHGSVELCEATPLT